MIGLNQLRTRVLITVDEVVFHSPIEDTIDPRFLLSSILVAERRFIKPMLGATVYNAFAVAKNKLVTTETKEAMQGQINEGRTGKRELITLVVGDMLNSEAWLNEGQKTLWNDYLHKIVAECVYFTALPTNRARFGATGVTVANPASAMASAGTAASIELKDLKHLMDASLQNRIGPLMEDMHEYLCSVKFLGYEKDCGCSSDGVAYKKNSSFILGMYDDDENQGCKW